MGGAADALFPGRDTPSSSRNHALHGRSNNTNTKPYDPTENDPVEHHHPHHNHHPASFPHDQQHSHYVVAPSIQVRSEFSTLTRSPGSSQPLTCIVVVELPGKRTNPHVPGALMPLPDNFSQRNLNGGGSHSGHSSPVPEYSIARQHQQMPSDFSHSTTRSASHQTHHHQRDLMSPTNSYDHSSLSFDRKEKDSFGQTPTPTTLIQHDEDSPFNAITEDLRNRIIDWKGHPLSGLGPLQMYDLLSVRRDSLVREFFVYLFKEAIICVVEERKRTLGRLLSSASGGSSFTDGGSGGGSQGPSSKGVLRLKGRIYIRHIKQVTDTSVSGEMSLTIDMEDERLDSFILIFKERSSLETWRSHIQSLVVLFQQQSVQAALQQQQQQQAMQQQQHHSLAHQPQGFDRGAADLEEFGASQKAMRMLSGSTGTTVSTVDSLLHSSSRSTLSSNTSHGSGSIAAARSNGLPSYQKLSTTVEEDEETHGRRFGGHHQHQQHQQPLPNH